MSTYQLSVRTEAESTEVARLLASQAGLTVTRVTLIPPVVEATAPHPFVRASGALDMPEGLDRDERQAYLRGYAAACLAYHRKHGNPSPTYAKANEWDRHPDAHKKGLAELAAYRERTDAYLAARAARQGVAA